MEKERAMARAIFGSAGFLESRILWRSTENKTKKRAKKKKENIFISKEYYTA